MVGVGGDEGDDGSRRRLPSWMVGLTVDSADSRASSNPNETSDFQLKSESKTRRRKKSTQLQQQEDDINVRKKKRKVREPAPQKKNKLKEIQTTCVDEIQHDNGDGEELTLTVEDLLSIAKEYVEESGCQRYSPNRDFDSEKQPPVQTSTSEQSLLSVNRTGNPAEDMLDLFLGPLLKKPVEEKNSINAAVNDMNIEFRMLSHTQKSNDAGQEHIVAPMKTKSSLKDKVAMFLE